MPLLFRAVQQAQRALLHCAYRIFAEYAENTRREQHSVCEVPFVEVILVEPDNIDFPRINVDIVYVSLA